uniref:Uncharacterized protein n=1 Tax=Malurus cyaneus samueli TaxID=2593467 RepID=A0A8C5TN94_9PASS
LLVNSGSESCPLPLLPCPRGLVLSQLREELHWSDTRRHRKPSPGQPGLRGSDLGIIKHLLGFLAAQTGNPRGSLPLVGADVSGAGRRGFSRSRKIRLCDGGSPILIPVPGAVGMEIAPARELPRLEAAQ